MFFTDCTESQFQCANVSRCFDKASRWCNGEVDCSDGSDELPGCGEFII